MVPPRPSVLVPILLAVLALLPLAGSAEAAGGRYVFDGGSARQRAQVRAALDASAFDWEAIPGVVTVHVRRGIVSRATPGHVWLDADLLDAGVFSWAAVQEEFAHQVDFLLLDAAARARLAELLGASAWCRRDAPGLAHDAYGCERFAAALVTSFWPGGASLLGRPPIEPATFRAAVAGLLAA